MWTVMSGILQVGYLFPKGGLALTALSRDLNNESRAVGAVFWVHDIPGVNDCLP